MDKWFHKLELSADLPSTDPEYPGGRLRVEAGLHQLGDQSPYFSVTGDVYERGRHRVGGCIHAVITRAFPALAPVIVLHLSNFEGVPMHAAENGWYWLAGFYGGAGERHHGGNTKGHHAGVYREPTSEECLQIFAGYVRIPVGEARTLAEQWRPAPGMGWRTTRDAFNAWVSVQRNRWRDEANAAVALLDEANAAVALLERLKGNPEV